MAIAATRLLTRTRLVMSSRAARRKMRPSGHRREVVSTQRRARVNVTTPIDASER